MLSRLGGAVAGRAPRHNTPLEIFGYGCLSYRDDPIEEHRYAPASCRTQKADTCSNVCRSERRQPLEGILGTPADTIQRSGDYLGLVPEPIIVHTTAAPDYLLGQESEGRGYQGGCWRRVADPHVADDQQVRTRGDFTFRDRRAGAQRLATVGGCQRVGRVDRLGWAEVIHRNLGR